MSYSVNVVYLLLACVILGFVVALRRSRSGSAPPGPPGLPFIGNLLDLPTSLPWITFAQWSARWGEYHASSTRAYL